MTPLTLLPSCQRLPHRRRGHRSAGVASIPLQLHKLASWAHSRAEKDRGDLDRAQRAPDTSPLPQPDWRVPGLRCLHPAEPQGRCPRTWLCSREPPGSQYKLKASPVQALPSPQAGPASSGRCLPSSFTGQGPLPYANISERPTSHEAGHGEWLP